MSGEESRGDGRRDWTPSTRLTSKWLFLFVSELYVSGLTFSLVLMAKNVKVSSEREFFDGFFPGLVEDIVKEGENDEETGDAVRRMREVSINIELSLTLSSRVCHVYTCR